MDDQIINQKIRTLLDAANQYLASDPNASILKVGILGELLTIRIFQKKGIPIRRCAVANRYPMMPISRFHFSIFLQAISSQLKFFWYEHWDKLLGKVEPTMNITAREAKLTLIVSRMGITIQKSQIKLRDRAILSIVSTID